VGGSQRPGQEKSPGVLIRRVAGPDRTSGPGFGAPRGGAQRGGRPQRGSATRGPNSRGPPRRRQNDDDDPLADDPTLSPSERAARAAKREREAALDEVFDTYEAKLDESEANHGHPTVPVDYSPAEQTLAELSKDWPNTPMSAMGLSENVVQKMSWLARDLPHEFWTPRQIAERLVDGRLVKFDSEDHKGKVMRWVEEMLQEKRARKQKFCEAREIEFLDGPQYGKESMEWKALEDQRDKKVLVDDMVRGVYPELPTGQRPLIASVQRQLRNNESYGAMDSGKLLGRITTLIETLQGQAGQQRGVAAKQ
jgi:hypothetical protein